MVRVSDTSIRFRCTNQHPLRVPLSYEGRRVSCPVCGDSIVVGQAPNPPLTETGAFRILSQCAGEPLPLAVNEPHKAAPAPELPPESGGLCCPRCRTPVLRGVSRCAECKLYLNSHQKLLKKIYQAALRSIR
jgi:hypothetical protein